MSKNCQKCGKTIGLEVNKKVFSLDIFDSTGEFETKIGTANVCQECYNMLCRFLHIQPKRNNKSNDAGFSVDIDAEGLYEDLDK